MVNIFTTINPYGNLENQLEALNSWSKYKVFSVNTKEEILLINGVFKDINFIETNNVYKETNKNLIKLDSILEAIESINSNNHIVIINSDIILSSNIKNIFDKKLIESLVIATRWEIDNNNTQNSYPFIHGYDFFMFPTKYIRLFKNQNYVIGRPWWDYWIPLIAIKANIPVHHIKNKLIFHRTHKTNYDQDSWIKFGEFLYKDIMINLLKNPVNNTIYDFCSGVKLFIESKQINIKIK